jgi:protein-S-isoprenylcysteine O-methyltransferase Ste14
MMTPTSVLFTQAMYVALDGAYLRAIGVILAFARTFFIRKRFVTLRMGWVEALCTPEPVVLLAASYMLHTGGMGGQAPTFKDLTLAISGAVLDLSGWALIVWSFLSWRSLFAGHGVLEGQQLVTRGAYGVIRHPVYLGAFLIWLGLAVAFHSVPTLLVTALYVVPIYVLYMRSEEKMMVQAFGEVYDRYREAVPMLIPSLW